MGATFLTVEAVVFGAIAGSILSSAAYRAPRGLSMFTTQRSRCDRCGVTVRWRDLVPVISWFALGGRCRWCGTPISPGYALTEIGLGSLCGSGLALAVHAPVTAAAIAGVGLLALALTGWRWRRSPEPEPADGSLTPQRHPQRAGGEAGTEREAHGA